MIRLRGALALLAALPVAVAPGAAQTPASGSESADTVVRLPGIEVTAASRIPGGGVARAAEVLDRQRLRDMPVSTVSEALQWGMGVDLQARSPAQADLSLRGGSFEQVLVLVDGVPVSDAQTGHFDLDLTVPLEQVERIEIVRGPSSSLHGTDALSGVVNIVTRAPDTRTSAQVRVEAGSFGSALGVFRGSAPLSSDWNVTASVQADRSDGHRSGVDHDRTLLHARVDGRLAEGRLDVQAGWAARDFGADGFYAPQPSYEETRTRTLQLQWTGPVSGIPTSLRAFHRRHDDDFILRRADPEFYRNVHVSEQWGGEASARVPLSAGWEVVAGAQAIQHQLRSSNLGDRDETRAGLFVEFGLDRGPLQFTAGARLEGRDEFGVWLAPSAGLAWDLDEALRLRAAVGRGVRTPTFTERYYRDPSNVGYAGLAPESATSGEVGLDWSPRTGAVVRTTVFRRSAREMIDWARLRRTDSDVPWQTRNVSSARFDGLELQVDGLEAGPLRFEAAGTWISVQASDARGFVSKYALRPLTRTLMAGARLQLPAGVHVAVRVLDRQRRGDDAGHALADGRLSVPVFDGQLWLDVTNLFDARYPDITGLPAPSRAVRSGLRLPLGGRTRSTPMR
jgi:iron complex outermembrane receptor protein